MGGDERTNGRTNGRTNERKSPCVLQDFVPFGAAAQKEEEEGEYRNKDDDYIKYGDDGEKTEDENHDKR